MYTVNPLPYRLLNYIYNFGSLNDEDTKLYISNILKFPIENTISKYLSEEVSEVEKEELSKTYHSLAVEMCWEAQKFIKSKNDCSSVSLRDIKRFNIIFDFYVNNLFSRKNQFKTTKEFNDNNDIEMFLLKTPEDIIRDSINISVFICYYLRNTKQSTRIELSRKMNGVIETVLERNDIKFTQFPEEEMNFILDNVNPPVGIARNKALLENILALFVCVNTKIPVFICGKPGCSKTLSFSLLFKAMKGENSENQLFKTLPKLIPTTYQGSITSTSENVIKAFNLTRKKIMQFPEKERKNIISV